MSKSYLDNDGVLYLWQKIKALVSSSATTSLPWSSVTDKPDLVTQSEYDTLSATVGNKADISTLDNYVLRSEMTGLYKYKGSVPTFADLPANALSVGDVYNVELDGMNYAWTGTAWDNLGAVFTITSITNSEIDAITNPPASGG